MIILFDLDGTLIDSTEAIIESFGVAYKHFGKTPPPDEAIKAEIGYPLEIIFQNIGVAKEEVENYVQEYKRHYRKVYSSKTVLLPFASEAVSLAKRHATLGVVTTKTSKYSIEILKELGILGYFDVIIGREDVENPKPNPEPILKALSKLSNDRREKWMIGDTPMDMSAAKGANIKRVGVTCGYAKEEALREYTDNISKNSLEAVKFITQI